MYKKTSLIILTIILASILVPLTAITTQAQEVTITSSLQIPQFYENQWFYVIITDPALLNVAQNTWTVFINDVPFTVQRYYGALKFWVIYNTTTVSQPNNPNPEPGFNNNFIYLSKNLTLSSGDTVVIKYYSPAGPAYTFTLTYAPTKASISLDRTEYPGFNDTVVYINIDDWDHNYDPTLTENYNVSLTITITWVNGTTTSKTIPITLSETGANSGTFSKSYTLNYLLNQTFGLTDYYKEILKIDNVALSITDPETGESSAATFTLFFSRGQVIAPATATYSSEIKVTITDPDMNLDSKVNDTAKGYIEVIAGTDREVFHPVEESPNSGVFKVTVPITYNKAFDSPGDGAIYINVSENNLVIIRYYDWDVSTKNYVSIYERIVRIEAQPVSLQTDKDQYLPSNTVSLTIIDPNLNDDSALTESFPGITIVNGTSAIIPISNVAELRILVNGDPATFNVPATIYATIVETGKNTGEFVLKYRDPATLQWIIGFNLNWLGPLKDGDVVTFELIDKITGLKASKSVTITVPVPTITTDRSEYPILSSAEAVAGANTIRIYVNVTDVFANTDPDKRDQISLEFQLYPDPRSALDLSTQGWIYDAANGYWYTTVTVLETDIDSSIFSYVLQVPVSEWLLGAKLKIVYNSPWYPTPITKEVVFKPHTARLEIVEDSAEVNGTITIKLYEPDRNLDAFSREEVNVTLCGTNVTLVETAPNSSVFEATVTLGAQYVYRFLDRVYIVSTVTASYSDLMTSAAAYYVAPPGSNVRYIVNGFPITTSDTVKIKTHTAEVYVSVTPPSSVASLEDIAEVEYLGPSGTVYVYVYDPDLKLIPQIWQGLTSTEQSAVASTLTLYAKSSIDQDEVFRLTWLANVPGLFYVSIPIAIGSAANDGIVEVSGVGDNVTIKFIDPTGVDGGQELIFKTFTIKAFDAKVEITVYRAGETIENPTYVMPNDIITVTACDSETVQEVLGGGDTYVKVFTTTDPVGRAYWYSAGALQLTPEGCFKITFRLDNSTSPIFKIGDTLTIAFHDLFAADGTAKDITVTLPIGKVEKYPIEPSLNVSEYKLINLATMQPVEKATSDMLLGVEIPIKNLNPWGVKYTVIAQVIKEGRIVAIGISGGYIGAGETGTAIAYLGYLEPGTYKVQIFIWQDIATMKPLSKTVVEFTLTVEG